MISRPLTKVTKVVVNGGEKVSCKRATFVPVDNRSRSKKKCCPAVMIIIWLFDSVPFGKLQQHQAGGCGASVCRMGGLIQSLRCFPCPLRVPGARSTVPRPLDKRIFPFLVRPKMPSLD